MAVWAYVKIEKSSPEDLEDGFQEFECAAGYDIVPEEFDSLEELIEHLKKATPGLCMDRDREIIR